MRSGTLLVAIVLLAAVAGPLGCAKSPDAEQYGEIINEVPPRLKQRFPLPQLEIPADEEGEKTAGEADGGTQNAK